MAIVADFLRPAQVGKPAWALAPTAEAGWELYEEVDAAGQVRYGVYLNGCPRVLGLPRRDLALRVLQRLAVLSY